MEIARSQSCPNSDDLKRFLLGKVAGTDAERIEEHIDGCGMCVAALEQTAVSDEFVEALRATRAASADSTKSAVDVVKRVQAALSTWMTSAERTFPGAPGPRWEASDFERLLAPAESKDEIGRLADFRVLRLLRMGGMGAVFEAEDIRLKRRVALKLMHGAAAARPDALERFLREAQAAAALKHDHLVTVYQVGTHGETTFLAMELLEGETLESCLERDGRLPIREVIRIGREIAMGLAAAHARGLLHRDIKPANIWLERREAPAKSGAADQTNTDSKSTTAMLERNPFTQGPRFVGKVKILDFGLAKPWADAGATVLTQQGTVVGTPGYLSPEQARGGTVDPRSDLFSLGCVMYRMATGRAAFEGRDLLSLLRALAVDDPPDARTVNPRTPAEVSDLIRALLSKSPEGRPPSAQAVAERLHEIEQRRSAAARVKSKLPIVAVPSSARAGARWRGPRRMLAVSLAILALFSGGYVFFFGAQLIRIATNKGAVVIELNDPDVEVSVEENGRVLLHDRGGRRKITLSVDRPHQLDVTVSEPSGKISYRTDEFTLTRGEYKVIARSELVRVGDLVGSIVGGPKEEQPQTHAPAKGGGTLTPAGLQLDRQIAEAVLSVGGIALVRGADQSTIAVHPHHSLPAGDFELVTIAGRLEGRSVDGFLQLLTGLKHPITFDLYTPDLTDGDLTRISEIPNLTQLSLQGMKRITVAGLSSLTRLTHLYGLQLAESHVITDAAVEHLCQIKNLRSISLGATDVTDAGMPRLGTMTNLEGLNLDYTHVTDVGLASLSGLRKLQSVNICRLHITDAGVAGFLQGRTNLLSLEVHTTPVTDAGLKPLQDMNQLEFLDLRWTHISDPTLVFLRGKTRLGRLQLSGTHVTGTGFEHLQGLNALQELDLDHTAVSDAGLEHLDGLPHLNTLLLDDTQVSDAALPRLVRFPSLTRLSVRRTRISAKGLATLKAALPNTDIQGFGWSENPGGWTEPNHVAAAAVLNARGEVSIQVAGTTGDRVVKSIAELPDEYFEITRASLKGSNREATDSVLKELESAGKPGREMIPGRPRLVGPDAKPNLTKLIALDLSGMPVDDGGLERLKPLTELQDLALSDTKVTDAGLASVASLTAIKRLVLDGTSIRGIGLIHLQKLPQLTDLRLDCPSFTDSFLPDLARLSRLKRLSLAKSGISDDAVRSLKQLTHLQVLDLSGTKVTPVGVAALQKSLPACRIVTQAFAGPSRTDAP